MNNIMAFSGIPVKFKIHCVEFTIEITPQRMVLMTGKWRNRRNNMAPSQIQEFYNPNGMLPYNIIS